MRMAPGPPTEEAKLSTVERDYLRQIANELERAGTDPHGEYSGRMARGIRDSGLLCEVDSVGRSISRVAAMAEWAFPAIISEIVHNTALLSQLIELTANPRTAVASESTRMGLNALRHGWYSDAVEEFGRAIAENRYDSVTHLVLGCSFAALKNYLAAGSSFSNAVKYGLVDTPQIACGAALLGAQAFRKAGDEAEAVQLLRSVAKHVRSCPEVALAYARASGEQTHLDAALRVAPELALDAAAADIDGVETISRRLLIGEGGLEARLVESAACLAELSRLNGNAKKGSDDHNFGRSKNDSYAVRLATAGASLTTVNQQLLTVRTQVQHKIEREEQEFSGKLDAAKASLNSATEQEREEGSSRDKSVVCLIGFVLAIIVAVLMQGSVMDGSSSQGSGWNDASPGLWILLVLATGLLWIIILGWSLSAWNALKTIVRTANSDAPGRKSAQQRSISQLEPKAARLRKHKVEAQRLFRRIDRAVADWPAPRTVPFYGRAGTPQVLV